MKLVCVNNENRGTPSHLTIGKIGCHAVIDSTIYHVVNDEDQRCVYHTDRFKFLSDVRNEKISQIL